LADVLAVGFGEKSKILPGGPFPKIQQIQNPEDFRIL